MSLHVPLLEKVVSLSCVWQSHPRLPTKDPPCPWQKQQGQKAVYQTMGTYTGPLVWVCVVYIREIHIGFGVLGEKGSIFFQKYEYSRAYSLFAFLLNQVQVNLIIILEFFPLRFLSIICQ